jgi:hypothetical protein
MFTPNQPGARVGSRSACIVALLNSTLDIVTLLYKNLFHLMK